VSWFAWTKWGIDVENGCECGWLLWWLWCANDPLIAGFAEFK
jgi:hypothetical protein